MGSKTEEKIMTKFTTASKKAMSLLLAMILTFSCMAVAASAAAPTFIKYVLNDQNCILNVEAKSLTVNKAAININSVDYPITFTVADPSVTRVVDAESGNTLFFNLKTGSSYVVKASITYDKESYIAAEDFTVKLKNSQEAPLAPIPEKVKATSIEIKKVSNAQYAIVAKASTDAPVYGESNIFKNLNPETQYKVYIRYKETDALYASNPASILVTTLASSDQTVPAKPVLADKTDKSITVVKVEGQLYSIDGGETWQSKAVFTNLTPKTSYIIITRKAYDEATQEETPVSEGLSIITNKRACYSASIDKCKLTPKKSDPPIVGSAFGFDYVCDAPGTSDLVYGDTRYVALTFKTNQSSDEYYCKAVSSFTPTEEGKLVISVKFIQQKYNGSTWEYLSESTKDFTFEAKSGIYRIVLVFQKIINLALNDIPAAITKFLGSGAISKVIDAVVNLGKKK